MMVADHVNYLTFEDPGAVHTVRRALNLARAGDLYGAAETAGVDVAHALVVSEGLRRGMRFSIGAEMDNDPRSRPDAQNIVEAMRPDGIIRTVHFIPIEHPEKGADWPWQFANPEFGALFETVGVERTWELYMARLLDDVEKLPGHVVGNFYSPADLGHWPNRKTLEAHEDRIVAACAARNLAIEINTRFLYRDHSEEERERYLQANARLVHKAVAKGVPLAVGSSAHSPKDQGGAFDAILKLLDDAGVNELVFPVGGRLARVVLRATREHLEAQSKREETVTPGSSITGLSRAELGLPEAVEVPASRRTARDVGPKKRASTATRTTKRPEVPATSAKSTSRRSAESTSSSGKAKAARGAQSDAKGATKRTGAKETTKGPAKPVALPKTAAKKAAKAKTAPALAPKKSAPAKPVASKAAAGKTAAAKRPAKSAAPKKPALKKAAPKLPAEKRAPAKSASTKGASARIAAAKKPAPKKPLAAKPALKKPAAKKATASKSAKKPAPKKATAPKPVAKRTAKPSRPAKKSAKKKPAAKRR